MPRPKSILLGSSIRNAAIAPVQRAAEIDASALNAPDAGRTSIVPKKITIHRLCLFGFDELKGNSLLASSKLPKKPVITSHTDTELAEICLPDGGHLRETDAVSVVFKTSCGGNDHLLFGYSVFRSIRDAKERRGAKQAALLLISDSRGMDMFRPFLADALQILLTQAPWGDHSYWTNSLNAFKVCLETGLNSRNDFRGARLLSTEPGKEFDKVLEIWNRAYTIRPPSFSLGDFGGGSLKDLLKVFREKTIKLWYAVAAERRIVFVGQNMSASSLSNLVLAMPLLLGELGPLVVPSLEPYITLAVVDRITKRRTFICGTNNGLFLQKTEWWDVCCDVTAGSIVEEHHSHQHYVDDENLCSSPPPISQSSSSKLMKGFRRKLSSTTFPKPSQLASSPGTGSPPSGSYLTSPPPSTHHNRSMGTEMAFVSRVLHDMEYHSEAWLRRQFHDFTLSFLNRVGRREAQVVDLSVALAGLFPGVSIMQPRIAKFAEQFPQTSLWKRYRAKQDEMWGGTTAQAPGELASNSSSATIVPRPASMNSPSSSIGFDPNNSDSFLGPKPDVKSLGPFQMETATGVPQIPTGFVSVRDVVPPLALDINYGNSMVASTQAFKLETEILVDGHGEPDICIPQLLEDKPGGSGGGRWIKVMHENGDPYYWNVASGETKWELSDEELL